MLQRFGAGDDALDEDMVRLKSLLEHGKTTAASGEMVRRDALGGVPDTV